MRNPPERSMTFDGLTRDIAYCQECRTTMLEFDVDLGGFVVESCARCKYSRQMTPVRPRSETETQDRIESGRFCAGECGEWLEWPGNGMRRKWCLDCGREIQLQRTRDWYARQGKKGGRPRAA